jgi:hypothetical protein
VLEGVFVLYGRVKDVYPLLCRMVFMMCFLVFLFCRNGVGIFSIVHVSNGGYFVLCGVARIIRNDCVCGGGFPEYIEGKCIVVVYYGDV